MTRTIITQLAAFGALVLTVVLAGDFDKLLETPGKLFLVVVTIMVALGAAVWEVVSTANDRPIICKGDKRDEQILKHMTKLLSTEEQCVISSNDLSWVEGKARQALIHKASKNSLTLLMPRPNELSDELTRLGATAHYYGDEDFKFLSRFTLVNAGRPDARVAIGYSTKDVHTIRTFEAKDDPAIHLADDLFQLVKRSASGNIQRSTSGSTVA